MCGNSIYHRNKMLLFPVIAWYGIIISLARSKLRLLLFPVIAWYGIIFKVVFSSVDSCCSQLSLGMV